MGNVLGGGQPTPQGALVLLTNVGVITLVKTPPAPAPAPPAPDKAP